MPNKNKRQHKAEWAFLGFIGITAIIVVSVIVNKTSPQNAQTINQSIVEPPQNAATNTQGSGTSDTTEGVGVFSESDQKMLELFGFWLPDLQVNPPNYTQTISGATTTYDFGDGNAISVMPEESLKRARSSFGTVTEQRLDIDGHNASRITGTSQKDGSRVSYIIISNADHSLFLRGDDAFLTKAEKQMKIQNSNKG